MMQDNYVQDGLSVKIKPCNNPVDPRTDHECNSAVFAFAHRKYTLGDRAQPYQPKDYHGWEAMGAAVLQAEKPLAIKPVYMEDHGGLALGTSPFSCQWDSGQIGWAFVPASSGLTAEQASAALDAELAAYGAYLADDLYDVSIEAMLSGEPVLEEYSLTRQDAEEAVTGFFKARSGVQQ